MFPHSWRDCKVPGLCATCKAAATLIGSANAGRGAVVADYRALFPDELDYAKAQRAVAFSRLRYAADNRTRRILRAALVWWRSEVGRMEKETMKPTIVCLCGSTRFYDQFQRAYYGETMAGKIVLSVGFMPDSAEHGEHIGITPAQKEALDVLHLEKVKMADEVLILNVGGYIGQSTARELAYALELGKSVRFLEETGL